MKAREREQLLAALATRFHKHGERHAAIDWASVEGKLQTQPAKLEALAAMESTGGEPDVVGYDRKTGEYLFVDCAAESPAGRRSVCYDREAWEARKEARPANNAVDMAVAMGVELLTEAQYRELQTLGKFDQKTSSWIRTPPTVRKLGGALFCDRRYDQVFTYHNGAQSYYAARGFRAMLRV